MNPPMLERDERTVMVENASYRWANQVLSFGLLIDAMYRSWVLHEPALDLLGLVILGGGVAAAYQRSNQVLGRQWVRSMALAAVLAAALALVIVLVRR